MPTLSKYNHIRQWRDGTYLAYNARSGAVALMDKDNYATYVQLSKKLLSKQTNNLSAAEQQLLQQLQYGSFVHNDDFSELDYLKFEHRRAQFSETSLGMVIAPTLACNMACPYCYEANKHGRMSPATVAALIEFVRKRAKPLEQVEIDWYGGEPLLALDIIEEITDGVLALGREFSFKYNASIITNGYLLTAETVDRLVKAHCAFAQVTLDGPSYIHNSKRPLKSGGRSFEKIVENLKYAATKITVGIRVNIDRSYNVDIIRGLTTELTEAGLRDKVWVNFGQLEPSTTACANIAESCYGSTDFSQVEAEYYGLLLDEGFRIQKMPAPISTFCMSQQLGSVLIDPDGDLFRCFNFVGDKTKAVGNITGGLDYQHPEFRRLFSVDPFEDDLCMACSVLPICMGSCPARWTERGIAREQICDSWKYNLEPMLEIIALVRQQQMQSAAATIQEKP